MEKVIAWALVIPLVIALAVAIDAGIAWVLMVAWNGLLVPYIHAPHASFNQAFAVTLFVIVVKAIFFTKVDSK